MQPIVILKIEIIEGERKIIETRKGNAVDRYVEIIETPILNWIGWVEPHIIKFPFFESECFAIHKPIGICSQGVAFHIQQKAEIESLKKKLEDRNPAFNGNLLKRADSRLYDLSKTIGEAIRNAVGSDLAHVFQNKKMASSQPRKSR